MKTIFPTDANVEHTAYSQGRQGQDQALYDEGTRENNMAAGQNDQSYGNKDDSGNNSGSQSGSQQGGQSGSQSGSQSNRQDERR